MNDIGMHTPEILRQSQAYLKTEVKAFLKSVSNRLQSEYPDSLAKIWKEEIEVHRHKLSLTEQDLRFGRYRKLFRNHGSGKPTKADLKDHRIA